MPYPAALRLLLMGLLLSSLPCTAQPMNSTHADAIDLPRFMGPWHVVAHVPYFGERGHVASRDEYTLRPDGKIGVRYVYQEGFGEPVKTLDSSATVKPDTGNRRWTTWFFGVIPTKYRILEVAPDYSWALIGYPGREMAWIFAREPDMDNATYRQLATRLRDKYDVNTDKLKRVPQHPQQVDKLGFEVPNKK